MNDIYIRAAHEGDIDVLVHLFDHADDLHHEAMPNIFKPVPAEQKTAYIQSLLQDADVLLLLAERPGRPVGALHARRMTSPSIPVLVRRRYVMVENVSVHPAHRSQGIGQLLMQAVHAWAIGQGIDEVQLTVWGFNADAQQFYDRLGYRTLRRRLFYKL